MKGPPRRGSAIPPAAPPRRPPPPAPLPRPRHVTSAADKDAAPATALDPRGDGAAQPKRYLWWYIARMRGMERISWLFEGLTATLSIVDVLSDILVAHQFASDGHYGWFWMVMASVIVSNIVYTGLALEVLCRDKWKWPSPTTTWAFIRLLCMVFPFAQAVPLTLWWYEARDQWRAAKDAIDVKEQGRQQQQRAHQRQEEEEAPSMPREDSWDLKGSAASGATEAMREDMAGDDELRQLVHRLDKGLKAHLAAHAGFYVETVVEAAPQAVIQLLAVTAMGDATWIQLMSMCLSLFSIVSKAYVVSVAFDIRAMVFKASLVAFDIFSLFFVFSTLIAKNEAVETTVELLVPSFLGIVTQPDAYVPFAGWVQLQVSHLAGYWLRLWCVAMVIPCLWLAGFGVVVGYEELITRRNWRGVKWHVPLLFIGAFLTALFPGLLALEAAKMSFLLLGLLAVVPQSHRAAFYALTFGFVRRGRDRGAAEGRARLHHLLHFMIDDALADPNNPADPVTIAIAKMMHKYIDEDRLQPWNYNSTRKVQAAQLPGAAPASTRPRPRLRLPRTLHDALTCVIPVAIVMTLLFIVVSTLFNLAYPFAHCIMYGPWHLNMLQLTCLGCCAVSLTIIVALSPFMYRFTCFSFLLNDIGNVFGGPCDAAAATRCMASYYTPPHVAVLYAAVSTAVLPRELVDVVGDYLTSANFDYSSLTVEQCARLRDRSVS